MLLPHSFAIVRGIEPRGSLLLLEKAVIVVVLEGSRRWTVLALENPKGSTSPEQSIQSTQSLSLDYVILSAIFCILCSMPRRPQVFHEHHPVDYRSGTSLSSLMSFSWAPKVQHNLRKESLTLIDLPSVGYHLRSRTLERQFQMRNTSPPGPFWAQLLRTFHVPLLQNWVIVLLQALTSFSVQTSIHRLLQCLEHSKTSACAWRWVAALAISSFAEVAMGCWIQSFCETMLEIPTSSQITLLVFQKSLRRMISQPLPDTVDSSDSQTRTSEINLLRGDT